MLFVLMAERRQFVQILIAIVLDASSATPDLKRHYKAEHADDPFYPSPALMSSKALAMLRSWTLAKPQSVLGALPGEPDPSHFELTGEMGDDEPLAKKSSTAPKKQARKSSNSVKKSKAGKSSGEEDEDAAIVLAGARVGACEFVWTLLSGQAAKRKQTEDGDEMDWEYQEGDPICSKGWDLLDVFVQGWEAESTQAFEGGQSH
jgi:hypothetical protein